MMDNHKLDPVSRQNATLEGSDYTLISLILSNEITPILHGEEFSKNLFGVEPIKPGIQFTP